MTTLMEGLAPYIEQQVPEAGKGFGVQVPQDEEYPAWSYQVIDDEELLAHGGGTGFFKARVQIELTAKETSTASAYANAVNIAQQIRIQLNGFKGNMNGLQVEFCKTTSNDDWADQKQLPSVSFDVMINYKQ